MICPKCLNEVEDDSLFCSICGSDLRKSKQEAIVDDECRTDTTSKNDAETNRISLMDNKANIKIDLFKVSVIIAIIGCALFFISADQISKVANDMINLRSESGTSLAESYYQDVGKALEGFAMFARALGVSVLAITIANAFKGHKNN